MTPTRHLLLASPFTLCSAVVLAEAQTYDINLPAQPLPSALEALARQTGIRPFYSDGIVAGKTSRPVTGRYTAEQALSRLLSGSGLNYTFNGGKAVAITATESDAKALPPMTVLGKAEYDSTDPYNPDYSLPNATTATKTDTPIMETPVSIQVVSRAVMNDQQAIRLEDITKNVSGVSAGTSDGNFYDGFIVRGFDLNNNTYRNGFRVNNWQSETVNLQSLEVLKGASAMLYGRIEPGGMVNLVTKKPLDTPYYAVQQQFGSYDLYRTTVEATGPVPSNDSLLYRFDGAYQNKGSFRDFIESEYIFIAPSLTWKASDRTQFNVNMEYRHDNTSDDYGIPAVGNRPAPIPINRNLSEPGTNQKADIWMVEFTGSHAFNDDWKLKGGVNANSVDLAWEDVANRGSGLSSDTQGNPNRILQRGVWFGSSARTSQGVYLDLNGNFDLFGMKHNVLFGGDYYSIDRDHTIFSNNFSPIGCPIDIIAPTYGCVDFNKFRNLAKTAPDWNNINNEEWGGVYFQDQITLLEKLHILGGGRYDWASTTSGTSSTSLVDVKSQTIHNGRFNPRVGVAYQPWQWLSIYGNYTESLGSANGLSSTGQPFAPQTATQYEGGIKIGFDNLTASLAYYYLTKDNILTTDVNTGLSVPVGKQHSQGIEFDAKGQLTDQLSMIASYAFTDARFIRANVGVEGNRVTNVPEQQASFWAKYDITHQFSVGTGIYIVGKREGNAANNLQLPGYARWDAMAAYKWDIGKHRLTAQVNVNNILDKEYYISTTGSRLRIQVGEPLSILGSLRLEL